MLTETWLTHEIPDSELNIPNFNVYRCDRKPRKVLSNTGGGALIAVTNLVDSELVLTDNEAGLEQVFVLVKVNHHMLLLGNIYIPPTSPLPVYTHFEATVKRLTEKYPAAELLLGGDFNLPKVDWVTSAQGSKTTMRPSTTPLVRDAVEIVQGMVDFYNLFQVNPTVNPAGNKLDLILCPTFSISPVPAPDVLISPDVHHPPIAFHVPCPPVCNIDADISMRNFESADYTNIVYELNLINWEQEFASRDVQNAVDFLYFILNNLISKYIPVKIIHKDNYPRWFNLELKTLVREKKSAHKLFKRNRSQTNYANFSRLRAKCKLLGNKLHSQYISKVQSYVKLDPKNFWKYVNSLKSNNAISDTMYLNSEKLDSDIKIANAFSDYFASVFVQDQIPVPVNEISKTVSLTSIRLSKTEIFEGITGLKNGAGAGPDGIPNIFLKRCVFALTTPLFLLFNKSLQVGIIPPSWKASKVVPVPKTDVRTDVKNFRPISILNSMPKLLEKLIVNILSSNLRSTIVEEQHGFFSGRSTVTNLAITNNIIFKNKDKYIQTDIIYTDFAKAFDKVSHAVLIDKLKATGFSGSLLKWLTSYLSERTMSVTIRDFTSDVKSIPSGVPQGSHLGPLLFLLFINDLVSVIKHAKILLFADDAKLIMSIENENDCVKLQKDLKSMLDWCNANGVQINASKCKVVRFAGGRTVREYPYVIGDIEIDCCKEIRDLGVIYSASASFDAHITSIISKAYQLLGFVARTTRDFPDPSTLITLYYTVVRPGLEYASPIWTPYTGKNDDLIEGVQHRFLRILARKQGRPMLYTDHDYYPIRNVNKLPTLKQRRIFNDLVLLYKILNGQIDCADLSGLFEFKEPQRNLRSRDIFITHRHRSNFYKYSLVPRLSTLGNEYGDSLNLLVCDSLTLYQRLVRKIIFDI